MNENRTVLAGPSQHHPEEAPAENSLNVEHQILSDLELAIIRGDLGDPEVVHR
jgi:hypothetical protein